MTAEIAVLNKFGVALAADSAITVEAFHNRALKRKVHNSANKLFTLSKHHPVGVMFYNSVTLSGIPWETIFKLYRRQLGASSHDTVSQYTSDFFGWLASGDSFYAANQESIFVRNALLRQYISLDPDNKMTRAELRAKFDEAITKLEALEDIDTFDDNFRRLALRTYSAEISDAADVAFKASFPSGNQGRIKRLASLALSKKTRLPSYSGIVIAGFGERECLPRLEEYYCDLMVLGRPRAWQKQMVFVDGKNSSEVVPLADSGVIETLVKGISPGFEIESYNGVLKLLLSLPQRIIQPIVELNDADKQRYINDARNSLPQTFGEYYQGMVDYRNENYTDPIKQAIGSLPVSELAQVAESFLGASQILKKVNPDLETIGGPVDVAVISKGDGFVWIKRKHYFSEDVNPSFKARYLSDSAAPARR